MKILKMSEVLLDGGTIEEIITDCGVYKRDNKRSYYKLSDNVKYYLVDSCCIEIAMAHYNKHKTGSGTFGFSKKKTFEQFYKEQLIRLYKKVAPYKCISFLNEKTTIEEISSEMDKLIAEMGK